MNVNELAATLAKLKLTLTAAESLTGGLFQSELCACKQAAKIYHGGFITYSDEAKSKLLGVPAPVLKDSGAVSEEIALAMAKGCRETLQADLGISFTGVGGPGAFDGIEPGTVWIGVADCDSGFARMFLFHGGPVEVIGQAVQSGASLLRDYALDNRDRLTCSK